MKTTLLNNIPAKHWIGGAWVEPESGKTFDVVNPMDDSEIGSAAHGSTSDIDSAVKVAHEAFESYRQTLPGQIEAMLIKAADLIAQHESDFLDILIDEVGSPFMKAKFEVKYAVEFFRAAAGVPRRINGKVMPTDMPNRMSWAVREPLGVVGSITPFNVPLIKGAKLIGSPLSTGNTVVHLPSEETPTTALLLAQIMHEAGFPAGTCNVVTGYGHEIGDSLTGHDLVRAVMFTGSSRVGRHISELCGRQMKPALLELGGKSPLVVLEDAELDKALMATAMGNFFFQGQGCMVSSRAYIQESVFDEFVTKLKGIAESYKPGDLRNPSTNIMNPIITPRQRDRIKQHVGDAVEKGATLVTGGNFEGNCFRPTILTGVEEGMTVCREETFGPVISVYPIKDLVDGMAKANDTRYGLSAAIFTQDINKALTYVKSVKAGMVHINAPTFADEPHVPFGGMGESGRGREGTEDDFEMLTEWKWVTVQLPADNAQTGPATMGPVAQ